MGLLQQVFGNGAGHRQVKVFVVSEFKDRILDAAAHGHKLRIQGGNTKQFYGDTHADTQAAYPLAQTLDKLYSGTQRAAMVGAGARRKTGISAGTVVLGVFLVLSAFFAPVMGYTTSPK